CDENCLLEACGNYLVQAGEDCDDGNTIDGDGCSSTCHFEYVCGDGFVKPDSPEQCDPPGGDHVCTLDEPASNPTLCPCDSKCQYVVCGDEKLQRPLEQCDPPSSTTGCSDSCQLQGQSVCLQCITADPDLGPFYDDNCANEEGCPQVENCIFDSGCLFDSNQST